MFVANIPTSSRICACESEPKPFHKHLFSYNPAQISNQVCCTFHQCRSHPECRREIQGWLVVRCGETLQLLEWQNDVWMWQVARFWQFWLDFLCYYSRSTGHDSTTLTNSIIGYRNPRWHQIILSNYRAEYLFIFNHLITYSNTVHTSLGTILISFHIVFMCGIAAVKTWATPETYCGTSSHFTGSSSPPAFIYRLC